MAAEVFNRIEKKYMLNQEQLNAVLNWIEANMFKDAFYTLQSLYYDTESCDLVKKSLSKPEFKKKLRLRAYGIPESADAVFLEIKMKYKGVVHKRRSKMSLEDAEQFIATGEMPVIKDGYNLQVLKEIHYMLSTTPLRPSMLITYDRKAYVKGALRMTIDDNVKARLNNLSVNNPITGVDLLEKGHYLLEVKSIQSLPISFVKILSEQKIYPTSFSKYGYAYTKGASIQ